jgi:hypothetical protein
VRSKARCECVQPCQKKRKWRSRFLTHGSYVVVVAAIAGRWQRIPYLALAKIASAPLRLADEENETRLRALVFLDLDLTRV